MLPVAVAVLFVTVMMTAGDTSIFRLLSEPYECRDAETMQRDLVAMSLPLLALPTFPQQLREKSVGYA